MPNTPAPHPLQLFSQDALFCTAASHQASGRVAEAMALFRQILAHDPAHAEAHHRLGALSLHAGQPAAALPHLKVALELNPDHGQYWMTYVDALQAAGHAGAARAMWRQGVERGLANSPEAATQLAQSDPQTDVQLASLAEAFRRGDLPRMESVARLLTMRHPLLGAGWKGLGVALSGQGLQAAALEPLRQAAWLAPEDLAAIHAFAHALMDLGHAAEAEACYRLALERDAGFAEAYVGLADTLLRQGRRAEAETACRRATELKPGFAEAFNNLGNILMADTRFAEAEQVFRHALSLRPEAARVHNNLGMSLQEQGRPAEAAASFRRALALQPDYARAFSNLLLNLNYGAVESPQACLAVAREFGEMAERLAGPRYSTWCYERSPRRLKVGLVSGDLGHHPVGYFLEGLLSYLDSSRVQLIAYPTSHKSDELTARIRPAFAAWKPLTGMSDAAAAAMIHEDGMHVLLDLAGHTASNRLPVFAAKPAPVQATWLGYFATTGVEAIDYLIADHAGVREEDRSLFTERIWYLARTRLCFTPPEAAPPVSRLPALRRGYLTFGCFQNLAKVGDPVLMAWGRIFAALPGARLRVQSPPLSHADARATFAERLRRHGIEAHRVDMHGAAPRDQYLDAHADIDAVLDTFPYPGGTTTCEALWMGVPTLTLEGDRLLPRQGVSLLSAAGLADWIARDESDYVARAVALTGDLPALASLRAGLREQVRASPLFDAAAFARDFEAALWGMWRRFEDGTAPGSD